MRIRSLAAGSMHFPGEIARIELLTGIREADVVLKWTRTADALEITLPADLPSEHAVAVKIIGDAA
jgi:hypothetical protein